MFFQSVVFLFCVYTVYPCSDITFNNVNVTLKGAKDIKEITGCFEPTEDLIKVSYIQIINQNIPVIKRNAINSLPKLIDVILEENNITDIEPGAFRNLSMLYLLKIRNNNIRMIREGVFADLPLTELNLMNNSIEIIHPNAFDNMPNLIVLSLNENKITSLSNNWFKSSPKVGNINLERNYISVIPNKILQNIHGEHIVRNITILTNIMLNDNTIHKIEDGAFNGPETLGWLFLHRNEIGEISENSLGSLKTIEWVRLDHNKLKCVPDKLVEISPKIVYYLQSNPLSEMCINKLNITAV
ncbi:chondroadherin [Diabrotica virgifera virgifera]|uniref:Chondroadherin-like n=1 Tax=Diabrotica virgifera virgifera TaxID=50390 RepID=A0A6P7GCQ6_DIAVI|nr:chondroadherin [Diabrotica virgifera virgifera]